MLSRPLDALELSAIRAYLEHRDITRCPATGSGEALPHQHPISQREAIGRWWRARKAAGERKAA